MTDLLVAQGLDAVRERMAAAARRAGRDPGAVTLVTVAKGRPVSAVAAAIEAGARHLGENRVAEAEAHRAALSRSAGAEWHMIGHLQRNKAKRAVQSFDRIDSVDSLALARRLDHLAESAGRRLPVLLQVNVADDPAKHGLGADEVVAFARQVVPLLHLAVKGLMTIGWLGGGQDGARATFRALRELRARLAAAVPESDWNVLSMGMSDDFEIAIEEGATEVRVGRAVFGARGTEG